MGLNSARARHAWACLALSGMLAAGAGCRDGEPVLLLTADTEGHVQACASCSAGGGLGDLSRRETALALLRRDNAGALLVDSGNALLGPDTLESGGRLMVAVYAALRYDAVNLSYRDFRLGKPTTVNLIKAATFAFVSANLVDEQSGLLLATPYVIKTAGSLRIAILGATELPGGVESLSHIRTQLAGVRVRPPIEALAEWLPKARAESDCVVLLYYGSTSGLEAVRQRIAKNVAVILIGGVRPAELPGGLTPPVIGTSEHGMQIARVQLTADGRAQVAQFDVSLECGPGPAMTRILKAHSMSAAPVPR